LLFYDERAELTQYGLLQASGSDARAFLHAQLTNDIEGLRGRARYAGWCSAKGGCSRAFSSCRTEGYLLQLARDLAPAVAKRLSMFILRSKVKVDDASDAWSQFGAWGDGAEAALAGSAWTPPGSGCRSPAARRARRCAHRRSAIC
jgi:folate-binding Fe-S cluster repair protein YgfZ